MKLINFLSCVALVGLLTGCGPKIECDSDDILNTLSANFRDHSNVNPDYLNTNVFATLELPDLVKQEYHPINERYQKVINDIEIQFNSITVISADEATGRKLCRADVKFIFPQPHDYRREEDRYVKTDLTGNGGTSDIASNYRDPEHFNMKANETYYEIYPIDGGDDFMIELDQDHLYRIKKGLFKRMPEFLNVPELHLLLTEKDALRVREKQTEKEKEKADKKAEKDRLANERSDFLNLVSPEYIEAEYNKFVFQTLSDELFDGKLVKGSDQFVELLYQNRPDALKSYQNGLAMRNLVASNQDKNNKYVYEEYEYPKLDYRYQEEIDNFVFKALKIESDDVLHKRLCNKIIDGLISQDLLTEKSRPNVTDTCIYKIKNKRIGNILQRYKLFYKIGDFSSDEQS